MSLFVFRFSLLLYALTLGTKYGVRKFGFVGSASQLSRIFLFLDSTEYTDLVDEGDESIDICFADIDGETIIGVLPGETEGEFELLQVPLVS